MRPMLATPTGRIPAGPDWVHEVKWDGMRVLADVNDGSVRLTTRTERDITVAFPEMASLATQYDDMLLDGEVVVMRAGVPSFPALAERFGVSSAAKAARLAARSPATYVIFDLLRLYGVDLTHRTWAERRATLERLDLQSPQWQVPPTFDDGAALLAATREQGLEGVVSKRRDSRYSFDTRSDAWLKLPHRRSLSVVIGGWRAETGQQPGGRIGSVLVGVPAPGGLRYLGRVGSGLAGRSGTSLRAELDPLGCHENPFASEVPREDADGVCWVLPALVCEVETLGLTPSGRLRQPAFRGIRSDLTPGDVDPSAPDQA